MITSIISGLIFIALGLGLLPIFTSLSLWWMLLGVPLILFGLICFLHACSIRRCSDRFLLDGDDEAMKQLRDEVNKNRLKI